MLKIRLLNIFLAAIFGFLFLSLFNLQVLHWSKYDQLSKKNCIRLIAHHGSRGEITDRNNFVIAGSVISYDVVILPQESRQTNLTLLALSRIADVSYEDLKKRFLKDYVSANVPVILMKNVGREKAMLIEENKFDLEGIIVQPSPVRNYSYGKLASHILGYLNEIDSWRLDKLEDYGYQIRDIVGFGGIEEKYDYYLRELDGGLSVEVDYRGSFNRVLGFKPPQEGKQVQLTIDHRLQSFAEDALLDKKGGIVIMDCNTAEVLALASSPDFYPAAFVKKDGRSISNYFADRSSPLFNRAISGVYPAGSVFKIIVAAAALETGKLNPSNTINCQGSTVVGNREFKCWNTHGEVDLVKAIEQSCDVFFYKAGLSVGAQTIYDFASKFGLGKTTGIELPYEASGFVPNPLWKKIYKFQKWYDGDTANLSIGQGELLTSPIQLARAMAVIANGGKLVTPYIVKSIGGIELSSHRKKSISLNFKKKNLELIRQGLRNVVSEEKGTANLLKDLGVSVAGKTGTAEIDKTQAHAWFVGFFPFENPKYVISVFIEKGGHGYISSILAKQIIQRMIEEKLL